MLDAFLAQPLPKAFALHRARIGFVHNNSWSWSRLTGARVLEVRYIEKNDGGVSSWSCTTGFRGTQVPVRAGLTVYPKPDL